MKQRPFTDYSLRRLMYPAAEPQRRAPLAQLADLLHQPQVLSQRLSIGRIARTAP